MQIAKQVAAATIPHIVSARCRVCQPCAARAACEHKALVILDHGEPPWIDASRCYGCRTCVLVCPYGALELEHGV
jgi:MinD superfamily P-loop ATPase